MVKVFVHGVPETDGIWRPLTAALAERGVDDVICLSPPGFGSAPDESWLATPEAYVRWLAAELVALRAAGASRIDIVGHDWGAGHVLGMLADRPDLVDSWATDCGGLIHPDYEWHDAAQSWQTEGDGEAAFEMMLATPNDALTEVYQSMGMTESVASDVAAGLDPTMVSCILSLYRAAKQPYLRDLGLRLSDADLPQGLIVMALNDDYAGTREMAQSTAERLGADFGILEGVGHWWMCQSPDAAADLLLEHWKPTQS